MTETATAALGDLDVAYSTSGAGEPVLLLHGGESDRGQFASFAPLLGPGIRAIAYDQRDAGATRSGAEPYDMSRLASDAVMLLDALGLPRAHVMGTSFGGALAMTLAIEHPERVASLALVGTTPSRSLVAGMPPPGPGATPEMRLQASLDHMVTPGWRVEHPELIEELAGVIAAPRPAGGLERRMRGALGGHDCTARLGTIGAPTLVVHGAEDRLIAPDVAASMADAIPGARLAVLPGVGHAVDFEGRRALIGLLRELVAQHPASSRPDAR